MKSGIGGVNTRSCWANLCCRLPSVVNPTFHEAHTEQFHILSQMAHRTKDYRI
jgi:hypothetical protein